MYKFEMDTQFIKYLQVPTAILTFEGEIVAVNDATFQISDAASKVEYLRGNIRDLLYDPGKIKLIKNLHNSTDEVLIFRTILKTFKSNIAFRTLNLRILSNVDKLILVFNYGVFDGNIDLLNHINTILKNTNRLIPFMSKKGIEQLRKVNNNFNISYELEFEQGLALIFARELNKYFPILSKTELYICALLTFGYTTKEIEYISTFSLNKIRVNISRVCKKLNLQNRADLVIELHPFFKNVYEL